MKASGAKNLFFRLTHGYFDGYEVVFANQSRMAKPSVPLVTIQPGNVHRPQAALHTLRRDGILIGHYESRISFTVDLFTRGRPVQDEDGDTVAYENTAIDEMLAFADFLNSPRCVEWCYKHDVSILTETDAQDLTGVVNDNNYEYRARLEVLFSFTQETDPDVGDMGFFKRARVSGRSDSQKNFIGGRNDEHKL